MSDLASLAIVIPVWNLPDELGQLLDQIARMEIFSQIVVVDDASDPACNPAQLGFTEEHLGGRLVYLRSPVQRGAGQARNTGLAAVTAENVLFFDADDVLAVALPDIFRQHLAAGSPDFTIFRHSDSRVRTREGSFDAEEARWSRVLCDRPSALLSLPEAAELCGISSYPWNKIYRTDFLREAKIRCSETLVHNDILLHWLSFFRAKRIQADGRIGATHVVEESRHHLTTRRGRDRLCLHEIFAELIGTLQAAPQRRIYMRQLIQFTDDIFRWNLEQIDAEVVPDFTQMMLETYTRFRSEDFQLFAAWHPRQAEALVEFMLEKGA